MLRASFLSSSLPQQAKRNVPEVSSFQPFIQFSPFLGREQELEELCRLLRSSEVHLLTLVGTGGVGKTCLALQAANRLGDTFVDGLCLVPLAPIRDPELVISTIAQALGLSESGGRPLLQRIKAHLQKKRFLLLLDNVEQVITAAPLLAELLAGCPNLKLLLTSREILRVQGEHVFSVLPLSLPDPCGLINRAPTDRAPASDDAVLARYPAVQLFIQKARAVRPDFQVTDEHVRSIAELCIHLDGLPLAIELAATHMKLLSPSGLLARLERRLPVLTGGIRDVSERQLTLRNTIKWSYDLLDAQEQRVFRRLAVFAGGCTLEAIEAVCQAVDGRAINVLSCVMALLDKHLLQYRPQSGDESRLSMLATIREYALECLEMNGEVDKTRRSHAEYYLSLAQEAEPELQKTRQAMWLERLEQEHDNLRAALHWLTGWEDGEKTLRLCAALWRFWFLRGHLSEGRQWLERALAGHRGPMTAIRAKAVEGIGRIVIYQSDFARAAALFAEYQAQFQELGDPRFVALALNALGHVQRLQGNYEAAQSLHEQSLALYREAGDRYGIAETLGLMANKTYFEGNCAGALTLGEESLSIYTELGDKAGMLSVLLILATVLMFQGDYISACRVAGDCLSISHELGDQHGVSYAYGLSLLGRAAFYEHDYEAAHTFLQESLALFRELGTQQGVAHVLGFLGHLTLRCGDHVTARMLLEEGLGLASMLEDRWLVTLCLDGLGKVMAAQRQPEWAARLWGASESLREMITRHTQPIERVDYEASIDAVRVTLGECAFTKAWAEGRQMTLAEVRQALTSSISWPVSPQVEPESSPVAPTPVIKKRGAKYSDTLTPREEEVMRLVASGLTDAEVADRLVVSTRTVHAHLRSIYSKLGVTSRTAAIHHAIHHCLL